jgi:hypothetical protein
MVERGGGSNLTNVQCKAIWNCHNDSLLYNEYKPIKTKKRKKLHEGRKMDLTRNRVKQVIEGQLCSKTRE